MKEDTTHTIINTMRFFSCAIVATTFLVATTQAQSSDAAADAAISASGVNVANVPDCAVSTVTGLGLAISLPCTESVPEQLNTIRNRLYSDRRQVPMQQSILC